MRLRRRFPNWVFGSERRVRVCRCAARYSAPHWLKSCEALQSVASVRPGSGVSVSVDPVLLSSSEIQLATGGPATTARAIAITTIATRRIRRRFFISRRCSAARRAAGEGSPAVGFVGMTPYVALAAGLGRRGGSDIAGGAKSWRSVIEGSTGAGGRLGSMGAPSIALPSPLLAIVSVRSMLVYRGWRAVS